MNTKGQGALEYLLLIGGAIIVAAVVLTLITSISTQGQQTATGRTTAALCAPLPEADCGTIDPDGVGDLTAATCAWDNAGTPVSSDDRCLPV